MPIPDYQTYGKASRRLRTCPVNGAEQSLRHLLSAITGAVPAEQEILACRQEPSRASPFTGSVLYYL